MATNNDKPPKANDGHKPRSVAKGSVPVLVKGRRITASDAGYLTPKLVVVPMQIFEKPQPVKRANKRRKRD